MSNPRMLCWVSQGAASIIAARMALRENPEAILVRCETNNEDEDNARFEADCVRWLNALADEYEAFAEAVDAGEATFLDPYGAEALEEFFAVASEAFFVAPKELEAEHPPVYELLKTFFRQDPARGRS